MTPESKPAYKQLHRPMSPTWWLEKPAYTNFMIRDITSVFIALYCAFLMVVLCKAMHSDAASFQAFYASWGGTFSKVLHLIALIFASYHSITFFNLTPRVVVVFKGEEKVPESTIALAHYALWAVASLVIIVIGLWV